MQLAAILVLALAGAGHQATNQPILAGTQGQHVAMIDMVLGKGEAAENGDRVTVTYKGNLLDGKVFDSTDNQPPFSFVLGNGEVIKGWDSGVAGMKAGGRRVLSVPPPFGYGDKGNGPIPANSTLIFDLQVLRVDKKGAKPMITIDNETEGTGPEAKTGDTVEINYTGTFLDGKKFDSSYDRNKTFSFKLGVGQVIKGFDMGVTGMKAGGKRKITIPSELAYGQRGAPGAIPPNTDLVFELELVSIK